MIEHKNTTVAALAMGVLLIAVALTVVPTNAYAVGTYQTLGSGTAGASTEQAFAGTTSAKLTVIDGTTDIAAVSVAADVPLNEISSLSFWKNVTEFSNGWNPSVRLGIDLDGDGSYNGDDFGWIFSGAPGSRNDALLAGDTFITCEAQTSLGTPDVDFVQVDVLGEYACWNPDETFTDFGTHYGPLADYASSVIDGIPSDAVVKVVKVYVGEAGSWMDLVAFVDNLDVDGTVEDFEPVPDSGNNAVVMRRVTEQMAQDIQATFGVDGTIVIPDENLSGQPINGDPSLTIVEYSSLYDLTRDNPGAIIFLSVAAEKAGIDWNSLTEDQKCILYLKLYLGV